MRVLLSKKAAPGSAMRLLVVSLSISATFGCGSAATNRKIVSLEDQVLALQNRADRLEERVAAIEWSARDAGAAAQPDPPATRPNLPLLRLEPQETPSGVTEPSREDSVPASRPMEPPDGSTPPEDSIEDSGPTGPTGTHIEADPPHEPTLAHGLSTRPAWPRDSIATALQPGVGRLVGLCGTEPRLEDAQ